MIAALIVLVARFFSAEGQSSGSGYVVVANGDST